MELCMSGQERDRLKVMETVKQGVIGTREAAKRMRVSLRQAQRLLRAYKAQGDRALVHGLRGQRANNALSEETRQRAMEFLRDGKYGDYGPTLAAEAVAEALGIEVSRETMRGWMKKEGLWKGSRPKRPHRSRRPRRACCGELVQMDTSDHDWLEGRGETMVLITMIDDATGWKLMRFARSDTTEANMAVIGEWIGKKGRFVALYTDWASHFKQRQAKGKQVSQTQIERALKEMGIELIAANSPQAKGRVERSHKTDQDRLVKGLRQAGATTMAEANEYLEKVYLAKVNGKFAKKASDPTDAHRTVEGYDLEAILCVKEKRKVQNDWTVSVDGTAWQIEAGEQTEKLRGQAVIVERRLDGSMRLRWQDRYLKFHQAKRALERRADPGAVDMPSCGQIPTGLRPGICPQALDNSKAATRRPSSYPHDHSHDEDGFEKEMQILKKPVRIHNCTRKPKPGHPWT